MKLTNLARTPEEVSEAQTLYAKPPDAGHVPEYPYGLCLTLDGDTLDKLGIKKLPAVGTTVGITAVAKVSRVSESEMADESTERSVELQITDAAITSAKAEADAGDRAAAKLYGKG